VESNHIPHGGTIRVSSDDQNLLTSASGPRNINYIISTSENENNLVNNEVVSSPVHGNVTPLDTDLSISEINSLSMVTKKNSPTARTLFVNGSIARYLRIASVGTYYFYAYILATNKWLVNGTHIKKQFQTVSNCTFIVIR